MENTSSRPEETRARKIWHGIKSGFKKAASGMKGNARAFAAAIPLVAMSACVIGDQEPENTCPNISLTRDTDGMVARIGELESSPEPGTVMTNQLIDFVNETHALSTEGMPRDDIVILMERGSACDFRAPTFIMSSFPVTLFQIRGMNSLDMMNHELGHQQPGGFDGRNRVDPEDYDTEYDEVMAELNRYEQVLMGFVAFFNQRNGTSDPERFLSYQNSVPSGLLNYIMQSATRQVYEFDGERRPDIYGRSNIYIVQTLIANGGNFRALRNEILSLIEVSGLPAAVEEAYSQFAEKYRRSNYRGEDPFLDISLKLKLALYDELKRRFGQETADAYLQASSHVTNISSIEIGQGTESPRYANFIYTKGLDSIFCAQAYYPRDVSENGPCSESDPECSGLGEGLAVDSANEMDLCCARPPREGETSPAKMHIVANARRYYHSDNAQITIGDNQWEAVQVLEILRTYYSRPDGSCFF